MTKDSGLLFWATLYMMSYTHKRKRRQRNVIRGGSHAKLRLSYFTYTVQSRLSIGKTWKWKHFILADFTKKS